MTCELVASMTTISELAEPSPLEDRKRQGPCRGIQPSHNSASHRLALLAAPTATEFRYCTCVNPRFSAPIRPADAPLRPRIARSLPIWQPLPPQRATVVLAPTCFGPPHHSAKPYSADRRQPGPHAASPSQPHRNSAAAVYSKSAKNVHWHSLDRHIDPHCVMYGDGHE